MDRITDFFDGSLLNMQNNITSFIFLSEPLHFQCCLNDFSFRTIVSLACCI